MDFETLRVRQEGPVLFTDIAAPPMNLLGTELVRDLVSLIQRAEADSTLQVLVFASADPDYFISHVDVTRLGEYRQEATRLTGEPSLGLLFRHLSASPLCPTTQPTSCAGRSQARDISSRSCSILRPSRSCCWC
jgi:enoyl-CoA hydratase/carnithine racemase